MFRLGDWFKALQPRMTFLALKTPPTCMKITLSSDERLFLWQIVLRQRYHEALDYPSSIILFRNSRNLSIYNNTVGIVCCSKKRRKQLVVLSTPPETHDHPFALSSFCRALIANRTSWEIGTICGATTMRSSKREWS